VVHEKHGEERRYEGVEKRERHAGIAGRVVKPGVHREFGSVLNHGDQRSRENGPLPERCAIVERLYDAPVDSAQNGSNGEFDQDYPQDHVCAEADGWKGHQDSTAEAGESGRFPVPAKSPAGSHQGPVYAEVSYGLIAIRRRCRAGCQGINGRRTLRYGFEETLSVAQLVPPIAKLTEP